MCVCMCVLSVSVRLCLCLCLCVPVSGNVSVVWFNPCCVGMCVCLWLGLCVCVRICVCLVGVSHANGSLCPLSCVHRMKRAEFASR